jgi:integrase
VGRPKNLNPPLAFHKGSGQFYVWSGGRRHYLGKDRQDAEVRRRKLIAQILLSESGGPAPGERDPAARHELLSVAGALLLYLRHATHHYHDPRQLNRVRAACLAARQHYGERPVGEFDQLSLQAIREVLLKTKSRRVKERPGVEAPLLSRNYVNHLIGCLQAAWTWLESQKYAPPGSSSALRTVLALRKHDGGREVKRSVAVEPWVVEATLPFCNHVVRAMVQLGRLTGMRPGEVCAMRRADISCAADEKLEVPETDPPMRVSCVEAEGVTVWVYVPELHKTLWRGKRRLVPLGPKAQAVITPFLAGRKVDAYLFSPKEAMDAFHRARRESAQRETQSVPLRRKRKRPPGPRYSTQSYERSINAAVAKANKSRARERLEKGLTEAQLPNIPEWTPNLLRKAAATLSDELAARDTTMALLGHSKPDTSSIYASQALQRAATFVAANG